MKNTEQKIFIVILGVLYTFASVNSIKPMTKEDKEGDTKIAKKASDEKHPFHELFTKLFNPKKTPPSLTSPRGVRRSATWPDFTDEPRPVMPTATRRHSEPDGKSCDLVDMKEIDSIKTAADLVNMLRHHPQALRNLVDEITLPMFTALLSYYGPDLLFLLIHDRIILDAIDRAINRNTFMQASETIEVPQIVTRSVVSEYSLNEPINDVTVVMLLAARGLTDLIALAITKKADLNVMNDDNETALDFAQSAYDATKAMFRTRAASTLKIHLGLQECRLRQCIAFLKSKGALTGQQEVLAQEKIVGDLVHKVLDNVVHGIDALAV